MLEKIKQIIIIVFAVFFSLMAILMLSTSEGDTTIIYMGLFFTAISLSMWSSLIIRRKQAKQQKELSANGIFIKTSLLYLSGLKASECLPCSIEITADSYKFTISNIDYNLPKSKVTDICIKKKTEIQKQYVSSIGGAAVGGALFGLAGAAYGGRAKAKILKNISNFLVFTYIGEKETDIKNIIFGIDNGMTDLQLRANKMAGIKGDMTVAKKIIKDFNTGTAKASGINIDL